MSKIKTCELLCLEWPCVTCTAKLYSHPSHQLPVCTVTVIYVSDNVIPYPTLYIKQSSPRQSYWFKRLCALHAFVETRELNSPWTKMILWEKDARVVLSLRPHTSYGSLGFFTLAKHKSVSEVEDFGCKIICVNMGSSTNPYQYSKVLIWWLPL